MNTITILLTAYFAIINIVAFIAYGVDKHKAKKGKWRTPETTLLTLAFAGGALGAWCGMRVFRHKTQHWKFRILVPLSLLAWISLVVWWLSALG